MSALAAAVSFGFATPIAFGPAIALLAVVAWSKLKSRTEVADVNEESLTKKLRDSKKSAASRRLKVSFVLLQVGWLLFCYGLTPFMFMAVTGDTLNDVIGATFAWLAVAPIGFFLFFTSIIPTDASAGPPSWHSLVFCCSAYWRRRGSLKH